MQCLVHYHSIQAPPTLPNGIPKVLMQTWKTEEVPKIWKRGQASILRAFPDWQYVLMTDAAIDEFVRQYFPEHVEAFYKMPYPIQRIDIFRYMFLYIYGGLYMDLDFEVTQSFAEYVSVLSAPLLLLHSGNLTWVLTNSLILARPRQSVFLDIIKHALYTKLPWYYLGKHIQVMFSSGPMAFHTIITNSKSPYAVLPRRFFMPVDATRKDSGDWQPEEHVFTIPLMGGTWNSIDSYVLNFLMQYRKEFACAMGILILWFARGHLHYRFQFEKLLRKFKRLRKYEGYEGTRSGQLPVYLSSSGSRIKENSGNGHDRSPGGEDV
jgi:mannosyltransferase OCH1-like enzyme